MRTVKSKEPVVLFDGKIVTNSEGNIVVCKSSTYGILEIEGMHISETGERVTLSIDAKYAKAK